MGGLEGRFLEDAGLGTHAVAVLLGTFALRGAKHASDYISRMPRRRDFLGLAHMTQPGNGLGVQVLVQAVRRTGRPSSPSTAETTSLMSLRRAADSARAALLRYWEIAWPSIIVIR